ncbi:MAG TPA: ABC transporter permease [Clostridia bacterium]|nr:ABC transporter permease [Clostridia bacterium]
MFRISKRTNLSKLQTMALRLLAIFLAIIASSLFILILGHNPIDVFVALIKGAFGSAYGFKQTIILAIPLVVISLGIAVAFKMKFWNIGAEGQVLMGAFGASMVAFSFKGLPAPLMLVLMALAGALFGGIWALIPAFFKVRFGTNETIFTLMMNYIAYQWIFYLQCNLWKDPKAYGFPKIADFVDNAKLPKLMDIHIGWIIALVLVVIMHIYFRYSKKGYEISVIGESENTARYAGMNVKKIILVSVLLSGALCGLAGMIQASGVSYTLSPELSGGNGFTAIITTWLGQLSAPIIMIVSILFAALVQGGNYIQTAFQIPQASASIIQGMILFFVLGSEFFLQYKISFRRGDKKEETK